MGKPTEAQIKWLEKLSKMGSDSGAMSATPASAASDSTSSSGFQAESKQTERVGRWMSELEYQDMVRTGKVQERQGGYTNVLSPPDATAYKAAPPGWFYVEFDVPASSLRPKSAGQKLIPGPDSPYGRLAANKGLPLPQMPAATNIKIVLKK